MEILYFYFSLIIGIYSFFLFSFKHPHLVQLSLPSFPYFPSSPLFSLSTPRSFPLSCPFPLTSLPFPCPTFSPVASFPPLFHIPPLAFPIPSSPFFPHFTFHLFVTLRYTSEPSHTSRTDCYRPLHASIQTKQLPHYSFLQKHRHTIPKSHKLQFAPRSASASCLSVHSYPCIRHKKGRLILRQPLHQLEITIF